MTKYFFQECAGDDFVIKYYESTCAGFAYKFQLMNVFFMAILSIP